ncbi:MAG TPA: pitrilysin family protein, partial [Spirochaetota bacterium]|nr:pitrilysin family protein [Spirochaetota bacterium]HOM11205.1 pitrilysin family protein [Spirochaetota bacterium]
MVKTIKTIIILTILIIPLFAPAHSLITLPHIETIDSNGVPVFYAQDTLPQCTVYVSIGVGSLYEHATNAGISQMAALVLSLGGSKNYPNINEYIDATGGRYTVSASFETLTISMRVHQDEAAQAFTILADIIANPLFETQLMQTARFMLKQQIQQKQDDPMTIAMEKARQYVFGDSGYGAVMTPESLDAITVADVEQLWKKYVVKENVRIGIVTSLIKGNVMQQVAQLTDAIPHGEAVDYPVDMQNAKNTISTKKIYFIEKDIPQSTIVIATVAPSIKSNNRYALEAGNYILGGGSFNSWLMDEIRVKRGYAYSTGSIVRMRKNTGLFLAYAQTSAATTLSTIEIMENVLANFAKTGPSQQQLQWAKDALLKSYIFEFTSLRDIVQYYMWLDYNKLPVSYIQKYPDGITSVTNNDITRSFESIASGYIIVVVGNKDVKQQLDAGKINYSVA